MDALASHGIADNTIVVFTSDHGGNVRSNLPGYWRAMGQDERRREDWLRWAGRPAADQQRAAARRQGVAVRRRRARAADRLVAGRVPAAASTSASVGHVDRRLPDAARPARACRRRRNARSTAISFAGALAAGRDPTRDCIFNFQPNDKAALQPAASVRRGNWKLIRWFDARSSRPASSSTTSRRTSARHRTWRGRGRSWRGSSMG